ncbi:MAG: ABC transporter substrate-binding protein [Hydrogenophilales bacterium]|nr:ABC transporter substrate-binding protein [Hydrogenophilales bacterium]
MKNKSRIAILAVIAALVAFGVYFQQHPQSPQVHAIRIAANLPMTGALATYGAAVREGANMALEETPSTAGVNQPKITVDWQDNASDPKTSVSIFQKQALNQPIVYVSGVKPQTMAIKDEVAKLGIPHFVWIFDAHINQGARNNLRTWVSYKIEPPVYLDYIRRQGAKRIAITYMQLPILWKSLKDSVPELKAQGDKETIRQKPTILVEATSRISPSRSRNSNQTSSFSTASKAIWSA